MCESKTRAGFTLIELLVVVSILAIVATAIFTTMAGGIRIWKRIDQSAYQTEVMLTWKGLKKDLRNFFPFQPVGFYGGEKEIAFPGLLIVEPETEGATNRHQEIARVRYYFDPDLKCLCKSKSPYRILVQGVKEECQRLISQIEDLAFSYYSKGEGEGSWNTSWNKENPPLALRLTINLLGENEKQFTTFLPLGK